MLHPTWVVVAFSGRLSWMGWGWWWGGCVYVQGWVRAWKRGFGCCLCHPESGRGESETGVSAGSLSAWVSKVLSGNQESVGVSLASPLAKGHAPSPRSGPVSRARPPHSGTWGIFAFLTMQWGQNGLSWLLGACSAGTHRSPHLLPSQSLMFLSVAQMNNSLGWSFLGVPPGPGFSPYSPTFDTWGGSVLWAAPTLGPTGQAQNILLFA